MYRYYRKQTLNVKVAPEIYECIKEKADALLITPEQYINTAILNQLHKDYADKDEYLKKIDIKNLI